jgi:aminomuconate-semialdehyde/2-hydroxymuconate-6-semialdehyde dehydrogenase
MTQSIHHFINGEFINGESAPPASGTYLDNVEPATGSVYSRVADGSAEDVDRAVEGARNAFPQWSTTPADVRSRILLRLADLIEQRLDDFALAESVDSGKPLSLARTVDIPRAIKNLRFFATAILHTQSEIHTTDTAALNYTLRRPRGVCGLISPWNLPLYLFTWKVAPAIATGNTAVGKPSELTPMTASMLGELCNEAELPPGVLNIVQGLGPKVGAAITQHPDVKTISFTGGTATGATIARAAAPEFKKLALEMGGKNPNVIFADADMDDVLDNSLRSAFANQGQICLCGSRIFVEEPAYESFVERFVTRARALRIGDPLDPETQQGALVSRAHQEKILRYIELAKEEGGTIRCGGVVPTNVNERCRDGFFVAPTVITDLTVGCRVNQEEIFGPVVTVTPFRSEREVVEYANSTTYGLAASLWTQNLTRAHRVADQIACGTIWVNCWMFRDLRVPFGGMKNSGVGREGGEEALRFFTEPKNVCVFLGDGGGE